MDKKKYQKMYYSITHMIDGVKDEYSLRSKNSLILLSLILEELYNFHIEEGHISEETILIWNDYDNFSYAFEQDGHKCMVFRDQNCKFFVKFLDENRYEVYEYYSEYDEDCIVNAWGCKTPMDFVAKADLIVNTFTDELKGNRFVSRPTLERLKSNINMERFKGDFKNEWNEDCSSSYFPFICLNDNTAGQRLDSLTNAFISDVMYTFRHVFNID